jgi:4-aminobutyrate aminotransferase/(S)-3-amino-2-methylpropionate transaminase
MSQEPPVSTYTNAQLAERHRRLVPDALAPAFAYARRASGSFIEDVEGRQLLDFASGIGTVGIGHSPPDVVAAIHEQAERFLHTCFQVVPYEAYLAVVERLVGLVPGDHPKKGILFNSGAEAVENAVKVARHATGRGAVLCFDGAFHGRTLLTLSLTSKVSTYKRGFGPFVADVVRVPFSYCYRCPVGLEPSRCSVECSRFLDDALAGYVDPDDLAAIVIEPILGEGGFVPAADAFLRRAREICDRTGAVLIADEVQSGFGRTGRMFAIEHSGVVPDLVTLAKSLAGGLPLSALVGRADLLDAVQKGGLGGTYAGNPVACAAALAALDLMEREDLPGRANRMGETMRARFERWQERHPFVGDVRGVGAMLALELVTDRATKEPDAARTQRWMDACNEEHLVVLKAGVHGNVLRVMPPLTIADEELADGLDRMERALERVA